ncbi:hypothetical protein [Granulicella tundricola]|uniref:Uncharacterized protein n=1 Tax=Granulicella tundricola (strain ATCC BAA-1859 / DSM 23138 / MP5ACTX9) TaxID=1198114 RepID=E8X204_GRATM|nr:hypothetical protein [Granulicella tundricola]ADW69165.1 hypothetical protein AciX9_2121 [Granulicella tundricola MP5ACTX9]
MLNSLTTSAHNSLPSNQVSRLLTGALLLAAAAMATGCNADEAAMHADLSGYLGHSHTWLDAADSTKADLSLLSSHHHAHSRELSRAELAPRHISNRVL